VKIAGAEAAQTQHLSNLAKNNKSRKRDMGGRGERKGGRSCPQLRPKRKIRRWQRRKQGISDTQLPFTKGGSPKATMAPKCVPRNPSVGQREKNREEENRKIEECLRNFSRKKAKEREKFGKREERKETTLYRRSKGNVKKDFHQKMPCRTEHEQRRVKEIGEIFEQQKRTSKKEKMSGIPWTTK